MNGDHGGLPIARIDASVNVNPLGPPTSLEAVLARARELAVRYPEIDASSARDAWASALGVPPARLAVGNGATELISLAVRAISPSRVVLFEPCYSEYGAAAAALGLPVHRLAFELEGETWRTPLERYAPRAGDLLVLGQPNNPTGHLTSPDALAALAAAGVSVLVDESFLPFSAEEPALSLVARGLADVTVVRSLTKIFCVPGLRLGLLAGDEELLARIGAVRDPWSVNGIACEAAVAFAAEAAYVARTADRIATERPAFAAMLAAVPGVRVTASEAPYLLVELPAGVRAPAVRDAMLASGIGVRDASTFAELSERWLRIAVRTAEENSEVAAALAACLGIGEGAA